MDPELTPTASKAWKRPRKALVASLALFALGSTAAYGQCVMPHRFANGQVSDATQVMANFNALVACITPGGATNSIQYNAGGGALAGLAPLGDGQLVIGSTGNVPQAQTLSAGLGISIANAPGAISLSASAIPTNGLYRQVISATPTSAAQD